ncbi:YbaK/EbsC family protein [Youngiibacter fragilis]|uniref:EBSC protein n=1 Tax=Youngiibacter fragilis 232.1 TaxID=994573 RepID=V7I0X5_9CLOT|nr:YbaK/EbsC family protein [Youngiibacter fragilis]ETA78941.1 EBSC protein [Youngiibacter fragilis 232.1]
MGIENVKKYFRRYDIEDRIMEFPVSTATVLSAAEALGTEPQRIAKTVALKGSDDGCILLVTAGDTRIDSAKFKKAFQTKAKMLSPEDALLFTSHPVGGVCPFGIEDERVGVYLDESLRRFDVVYPACGSANSAIGLKIPELEVYSGMKGWVDVCRLPEI